MTGTRILKTSQKALISITKRWKKYTMNKAKILQKIEYLRSWLCLCLTIFGPTLWASKPNTDQKVFVVVQIVLNVLAAKYDVVCGKNPHSTVQPTFPPIELRFGLRQNLDDVTCSHTRHVSKREDGISCGVEKRHTDGKREIAVQLTVEGMQRSD